MPADDDFSVAAQLMRLKSRGSISDERVLAEIGILFVGGFQTTAHTISWTLFCIATNRGEYIFAFGVPQSLFLLPVSCLSQHPQRAEGCLPYDCPCILQKLILQIDLT